MKDYFFAIGYIPHRLWGNILMAVFLEKDTHALYYVAGEVLQFNEQSTSYQRLSPMQKEVVQIIDQYNDRKLHSLFSKKKTVKEFMDTIDKETIVKFVRPYIEKRLYKALQIATENGFKVFIRDKGRQNIFNDDFLTLHKTLARPLFHFSREEEQTQYRLSIFHQGIPIRMNQEYAEIICNHPAVLMLGNNLYFVERIEGTKLTPFFIKEFITVQKSSEKKYFSTFVSNTLKDYEIIDNKGFIIEETVPEKQAVITLEPGLNSQPTWLLQLRYNDYTIYPGSSQIRFVKFHADKEPFAFTRFQRDEEWEDQLDIVLEEIGLKTRDRNNYYLKKRGDTGLDDQILDAINFTNEHYSFLTEHGFSVHQKFDRPYYIQGLELRMKSVEKEDWFDLHAVVVMGNFEIPFIQLKNHILNGRRIYDLPDGTCFVIPTEWFARYKALFEFGKPENDLLRIHKQHFSMVDEAMRKNHVSTFKNLEKLINPEVLPAKSLPKGLKVTMRDYQKDGYAWLLFLQENGFGGCLADDMGLGKTLQTIAILQSNKELHSEVTHESSAGIGQLSLFQSGKANPVSLVVVPASLIQNWINEIGKFAPSLQVYPHVGQQREKSVQNFQYFDVIISSYHTVRQDIEFISDFNFHYVILDESQMIKNPSSKLYRAMEELQANHKLVLTGTPIENSLTDLWSQINFVNEGLLGNLNFFKKRFVQPIEKRRDKEQEQLLKDLIKPFILRRTKEEVAKELPPVYEQYRYCNMTEEQKRFYEEEKSSVRNTLLESLEVIGLEKSTIIVLKALTRLRQISNHPLLVEDDYTFGSGKYDEVFRNIESVVSEGHKVLVFSSFVKHLDLYAHALKELGWKFSYLTGSTRDRAGEVDHFQNDEECKIFLISLKAGGVGLNLTAADYVFILDPWWNPAAEMQALSRAHRIGQDKSVFVYRFISNHTVEEKIQHLQEKKSNLAKSFVSSNNPLKDMKKEDIYELFS